MNEDRGMMKWAPFQSLVEQATSLAMMRRTKSKIEKPLVSNDQAEEINERRVYHNQQAVRAQYWEDGYLYEKEGIISKIDGIFRFLILEGKKISFSNLIRLVLI